ncbi:hypothetical protein ABW20_dc0106244 [Dactylellina cionopaga]|nr:hypothetical protein ABW20_dc0106244 [Dactylellina cionopaga]
MGAFQSLKEVDIEKTKAARADTAAQNSSGNLSLSDNHRPPTSKKPSTGEIEIEIQFKPTITTEFGSPKMEEAYKQSVFEWIGDMTGRAKQYLKYPRPPGSESSEDSLLMTLDTARILIGPPHMYRAILDISPNSRARKDFTDLDQQLWDWVFERYKAIILYMRATSDRDWSLLGTRAQAMVYYLPFLKNRFGLKHYFTLTSISTLGTSYILEKLSLAKDGIRMRDAVYKIFLNIGFGYHGIGFSSLHDEMDWATWQDHSPERYEMVLRRSISYYKVVREEYRYDSVIVKHAVGGMMKALSKVHPERFARIAPIAARFILSHPRKWQFLIDVVCAMGYVGDAMLEVGMVSQTVWFVHECLPGIFLYNDFAENGLFATFMSRIRRPDLNQPVSMLLGTLADCYEIQEKWLQALRLRVMLLSYYEIVSGLSHRSTIICSRRLGQAIVARGPQMNDVPGLRPEWRYAAKVYWEIHRRGKSSRSASKYARTVLKRIRSA